MTERSTCWHCDREASVTSLEYDTVLVPRTARDGGPILTWDCPDCGRQNVVEKNAAGERLLVPPSLRRVKAIGARAVEERRWASENVGRRHEFHSRTPADRGAIARDLPDPQPAAGRPEGPPPGPREKPEAEPEPERTSPREISSVLEAYEVLGLPLTAGADEIRQRFRNLSKKCHPDRVAGLDDEIRRTAERRFREIRRAYEVLTGN